MRDQSGRASDALPRVLAEETPPEGTTSQATTVAEDVPIAPLGEDTTASRTVTVSTGPTSAGWVSRNLRNGVVIALTLTVIYLALVEQNASAIAGLIAAWTWSAGGMFQERAALKQPGKDA